MAQDKPDQEKTTDAPAQPSQNLSLFDRIQNENSGRNFDYFQATDKNNNGFLSRDEVAKGINNSELGHAQREWMELMHANFDVVSKLSDPSKTKGISREDEQAVKYLSSMRQVIDSSVPATVEFAKANFAKLDANGNGRIEVTDVEQFERLDSLSKATDPNSGLSQSELNKTHNLKTILQNMQPLTDAKHYRGGWVADLNPSELGLTSQQVYDLTGQKYVRDTLIGPYGQPNWKDVAATVPFGIFGFLMAPNEEGIKIGIDLGVGIVKNHREQTKDYYAARDGIKFYQQYKRNGLDGLLSRVSTGGAESQFLPRTASK